VEVEDGDRVWRGERRERGGEGGLGGDLLDLYESVSDVIEVSDEWKREKTVIPLPCLKSCFMSNSKIMRLRKMGLV
jgi:hypothetical protein